MAQPGASEGLDLIAIGRAAVDLYGEQIGAPLEAVGSFAKYLGGSPANTAVGAARLGLKSAILSRVGGDHMGRFIREEMKREGVDVRGLKDDGERLTALVFLGIRDPDTFPLLFYRENCADMALCEEDIDPAFIRAAKAVVLSGTHLSKPNVFAASMKAATIAKETGNRVALDIDYRPVLWGVAGKDRGEDRFVAAAQVTEQMQRVLPLCDLVVGTEEEIHIIGGTTDTRAALEAIRAKTPGTIVMKRGAAGCVAYQGAIPKNPDDGVVGAGFPVEVFNVLGAGDAFMAGFLRGWLRDMPPSSCCELANAAGAIVVSRHGCAPAMPTWPEMEAFLAKRDRPFRLREDAELEHIHWATTRRGAYDELTVLAIDHRTQFEELAQRMGVEEARIGAFKTLALAAVSKLAGGDPRFGLIIDGRHGMRALEAAADHPYWIARPIELPGSKPLAFEGSADVANELRAWPLNHVVKCLAFYHPDDDADLKARQERQLIRLFDACRQTRHEFLLEIIVSKNGAVDAHTTARALQRIYDIGIKPDWWKLEPVDDGDAWAAIERTINANDPYCRGVVLLGLSAPKADLVRSFAVAAKAPIVKGFAVGRTIFTDAAEEWFAGKMSDAAVIDALAANLGELTDAWRAARAAREKSAWRASV
ncbi:MAG: 5-dehydro-2-deoxygluconokinase [Hyphomonadaceae bacterium]